MYIIYVKEKKPIDEQSNFDSLNFFFICVISLFFWKKKIKINAYMTTLQIIIFSNVYVFSSLYIYIYEIKMKLALIWLNDVVIIYLTINVHLIRKCNLINLTQIIDNFWNNDVQSNSKHILNI